LDRKEREKTGKKAVSVAISGNIILTILNFIVGTLSGSVALVAESSHTLSDVLTSIITAIGFRIGMIPPDSDHPFGHGRAEPLTGLVIVVFLLIIAFEILSEVYRKLTAGGVLNPPDMTAALMAIVGIGANLAMTTYMMRAGNKINSSAIVADAQHQKVDIFSCSAILIGVIGSRLGIPVLDPIVAIFISIMVLKTAFDIGKKNINSLMGTLPSKEILVDIKTAALSVEGVFGIHKVRINYMGPYASLDLHVEVMDNLTLKEAHEIAHNVEKKIIESFEVITMVTVHVCPKGESFCVESLNEPILKK
jgi:cation diffusion facilitator family transporter